MVAEVWTEKIIYINRVSNRIMFSKVMFPGIIVSVTFVYAHSLDQILYSLIGAPSSLGEKDHHGPPWRQKKGKSSAVLGSHKHDNVEYTL